MTTITQVITALPTAPDPATMTRDEFSVAAAAFVLAQKDTLQPEINTWAGQVNTVKGEMVADAATATTQAGIATTKAAEASDSASAAAISESAAASDAANTAVLLANAGSMLGINFGAFTMVDNELIVTHLTTATPSIVNGDLILDYETL